MNTFLVSTKFEGNLTLILYSNEYIIGVDNMKQILTSSSSFLKVTNWIIPIFDEEKAMPQTMKRFLVKRKQQISNERQKKDTLLNKIVGILPFMFIESQIQEKYLNYKKGLVTIRNWLQMSKADIRMFIWHFTTSVKKK